ncbi:DEAD-box ATP-dependent RNA helicase [Arachis hypogaea]|nr:DEAD-box ATP-dependent RNA helicase [Arachis hypogaea]
MVGLHTRLRRVSLGEVLILLLALQDHIERENVDLSQLKFRVLDEANEMLRMGFVEEVELILGKVQDVSKVQTLLFSATLPELG